MKKTIFYNYLKKDKQKVAELKEAIKNKKQETSKIIEKYNLLVDKGLRQFYGKVCSVE